MACKGRGYSDSCGSNPELLSFNVLDSQGRVITSAHPGDIVHLVAVVGGADSPCSNYYLMFYGRNAEYLECYQDYVNDGATAAVAHPYGVPNYPGETITLAVLEVLSGMFLSVTLEILAVVEGEAAFIWVTAPSEFTPYIPFDISVTVQNNGGTDDIFSRIINQDTGTVISELVEHVVGGGQHVFVHTITLTQNTYFHCLIQIGHEESVSTSKVLVTPGGCCHV